MCSQWRLIGLGIHRVWSVLAVGERCGSVVECRTPEREVGGSKLTAAVLCPWVRHFTPRKYWLITQEAMAPSRHDWKIVDWDVKPQHKQTKSWLCGQWVAKDPSFLHADSVDSDQTKWMSRRSESLLGAHAIWLVLSWGGSYGETWKKMYIKLDSKAIFFKPATNWQKDKGFLLTSTFVATGLSAPALGWYTCIKALKYIPGPGFRGAFTGPLVLWFLHLCSKFSLSHSVKVLKLCQLISSRIIAVINTMSTCQSVLATPVKTSNGALLPY